MAPRTSGQSRIQYAHRDPRIDQARLARLDDKKSLPSPEAENAARFSRAPGLDRFAKRWQPAMKRGGLGDRLPWECSFHRFERVALTGRNHLVGHGPL
jgi:hypothetical protein